MIFKDTKNNTLSAWQEVFRKELPAYTLKELEYTRTPMYPKLDLSFQGANGLSRSVIIYSDLLPDLGVDPSDDTIKCLVVEESKNQLGISSPIAYKYNEAEILEAMKEYVDSTYSQHYAQGNIEATEYIIDQGHGIGFLVGNIIKYASRYGKKGNRLEQKKDLQKSIHYAIMALYLHELEEK